MIKQQLEAIELYLKNPDIKFMWPNMDSSFIHEPMYDATVHGFIERVKIYVRLNKINNIKTFKIKKVIMGTAIFIINDKLIIND